MSGAVGLARGAVQGGVERTRSALSTGVSTVAGCRVGRLLATGVDAVLGKSEELVERYLPGTDEELGECPPHHAGNHLPNLGVPTPPHLIPPHRSAIACTHIPCLAPTAVVPGQLCGARGHRDTAQGTVPSRREPEAGERGAAVAELSPGNQKANIALCRPPRVFIAQHWVAVGRTGPVSR